MGKCPPGGTAEVGKAPDSAPVRRSVVERMSCPPQVRRLGVRAFLTLRPIIWAQICYMWQRRQLAKRNRKFEASCVQNWANSWFLTETGFVPQRNEWWAFKKAQCLLTQPHQLLERLMSGIVPEFLRHGENDRVPTVACWIFQDLMTRLINKPRMYREHGPAALRGLLAGVNALEEEGRLDAMRQDEKSVDMIVAFVEHLAQAHENLDDLGRQIKEKLT